MEKWISNFPHKQKKMNKLKLPGTHHSAINRVNTKFSFIKSMTLTQDMSVYDQLRAGIRFLDIRIAYHRENIYVAHTFIGKTLDEIIDEILKFNMEYKEPFILKFRIDSRNNKSYDNTKADPIFMKILKRLDSIKYDNSKIPTIEEIGSSIIILNTVFETTNIFEIPYINTTDVNKKFINIFLYSPLCLYNNYGLVDISLTPSVKDFFISFFIDVLRKYSNVSNTYFIENTRKEDFINMNAIICDYPTKEWIEKVVGLNFYHGV